VLNPFHEGPHEFTRKFGSIVSSGCQVKLYAKFFINERTHCYARTPQYRKEDSDRGRRGVTSRGSACCEGGTCPSLFESLVKQASAFLPLALVGIISAHVGSVLLLAARYSCLLIFT
jgi:hypothetical protein